jgi:hypothetical protein
MKLKLTMVLSGLSSFLALSAHADWNAPVTYAESIYACDGMTPNLNGVHAVNVATDHGEIRVPEETFITVNSKISITDPRAQLMMEIGSLASVPTCTIEDAGEPARPSWNRIQFNPGTALSLSFSSNPRTCRWDPENDGFSRKKYYVLTAKSANITLNYSWVEDAHYPSSVACEQFE